MKKVFFLMFFLISGYGSAQDCKVISEDYLSKEQNGCLNNVISLYDQKEYVKAINALEKGFETISPNYPQRYVQFSIYYFLQCEISMKGLRFYKDKEQNTYDSFLRMRTNSDSEFRSNFRILSGRFKEIKMLGCLKELGRRLGIKEPAVRLEYGRKLY